MNASVTVRIPGAPESTYYLDENDMRAAFLHYVAEEIAPAFDVAPEDFPADPEADAIIEEAATDSDAFAAFLTDVARDAITTAIDRPIDTAALCGEGCECAASAESANGAPRVEFGHTSQFVHAAHLRHLS